MTQRVRVDFINWSPDQEDLFNQGLTKASNVFHDDIGYRPIKTHTAPSQFGNLASVSSLRTRAIGSGEDVFCAWVTGNNLNVGVNGVTSLSAGATAVSFATAGTSQEIVMFDVAEFEDYLFFTVEAQQEENSQTTTTSIRKAGYLTVANKT